MGLTHDVFEFPSTPPAQSELEAALRANGADPRSLDTYVVTGNRVELCCMLDRVTVDYAYAFLEARGGRALDPKTHAPGSARAKAYTARPFGAYPWLQRLRIRYLGRV